MIYKFNVSWFILQHSSKYKNIYTYNIHVSIIGEPVSNIFYTFHNLFLTQERGLDFLWPMVCGL